MKRIGMALRLLFAGATLYAQGLTEKGLAIGRKAPDFSAPDQDGALRTLKSLLGPKGAMLVFFRSADW